MKKAKFSLFENEINFDENYVNVLEIQNKEQFKKIVYLVNLYSKEKEVENEFMYIENNYIVDSACNILVMNDFFNVESNNKKILKLLHEDIKKKYNDEFGEFDIRGKFNLIYKNIQEILIDYDYEFEYKLDIDVIDFLKMISLKFDEKNYDTPLKNIYFILDIISDFQISNLLVLINLKSFLDDDELTAFYKAVKQRDIAVLLIEGNIDKELKMYENKLIIDSDYDEFIEKYVW
ncbi:MAG: type II-A CRISPR-associated protein Csn2 [Sarcina sp.]